MPTTNVNTSPGGPTVFLNTFACITPHAPAWTSNVNTAMQAHVALGVHLDDVVDTEDLRSGLLNLLVL